MLQCVAVCCSVLQCVAVRIIEERTRDVVLKKMVSDVLHVLQCVVE